MDVNDFIGLTEFESGSGVGVGFNKPIAGNVYTAAMLKVDGYDTKDWSPVFTPLIKDFNITIGYRATASKDLRNSVAIGNHTDAAGDNCVQIGNWDQQIYIHNEIAVRNDERDMSDIEEIDLGLEFVDRLRPVKYRMSFRDKTIEELYPYPHPINAPIEPNESDYRIQQEDGSFIVDTESYMAAVDTFNVKNEAYLNYCNAVETVRNQRMTAYSSITGTAAGDIWFGFIGSEVVNAATDIDPDYKPVINPTTLSIGYDVAHYYPMQILPPIVKALQEAHELIKELRTDVDQLQTEVLELKDRTTTLETQMQEVRTQLGLP